MVDEFKHLEVGSVDEIVWKRDLIKGCDEPGMSSKSSSSVAQLNFVEAGCVIETSGNKYGIMWFIISSERDRRDEKGVGLSEDANRLKSELDANLSNGTKFKNIYNLENEFVEIDHNDHNFRQILGQIIKDCFILKKFLIEYSHDYQSPVPPWYRCRTHH
uniref:Uncharacterized protein n=1 Tax=Romanomermis culicivorax TaxID=13658 RepID=A0A915L1D2_ROMCU